MAVLVRKEPEKRYQKLGMEGTTQSEREQADRLDQRLEKRIKKLVEVLNKNGLMPKKQGKGKLLTYREVGVALRDVVESNDFPHKAELPLLWRNAKMYIPAELLYKERGPYREHLWYCYRLAGYPKELALKMKWGEWVTIFDSAGVNQEPRFDAWFQDTLSEQNAPIERSRIRMFAPCVNVLLGDIDVSGLSDSELRNCYEAAWQIATRWHKERETKPNYADGRQEVQKHIADNLALLDDVMDGTLSPHEFAVTILGY
jgi:hypothetical protein